MVSGSCVGQLSSELLNAFLPICRDKHLSVNWSLYFEDVCLLLVFLATVMGMKAPNTSLASWGLYKNPAVTFFYLLSSSKTILSSSTNKLLIPMSAFSGSPLTYRLRSPVNIEGTGLCNPWLMLCQIVFSSPHALLSEIPHWQYLSSRV